jgi:hypothetical protein
MDDVSQIASRSPALQRLLHTLEQEAGGSTTDGDPPSPDDSAARSLRRDADFVRSLGGAEMDGEPGGGGRRGDEIAELQRLVQTLEQEVAEAPGDGAADDVDWRAPPPPAEGGEIPVVNMRWTVSKLQDIDTVNSSACIDITITFYWTDPRVRGLDDLPHDLWGPCVYLRSNCNAVGQEFNSEIQPAKIRDQHSCRLQRRQTFEGIIHNIMDLNDFPFDTDKIKVAFYTASHWQGHPSGEPIARGSSTSRAYALRPVEEGKGEWVGGWWNGRLAEFECVGISTTIEEVPQTSVSGVERTNISLSFCIRRKATYYFWKVLMPLFLLTALSSSTFGFAVDDFAGRSGNVATYFLAAFAMLYVVGEALPKTDFLTKVDEAIVLTTLTLASTGLASRVFVWAHEEYGEETAKSWNRQTAIWSLVFYVGCTCAIFLPAWMRQRQRVVEWSGMTDGDRAQGEAGEYTQLQGADTQQGGLYRMARQLSAAEFLGKRKV